MTTIQLKAATISLIRVVATVAVFVLPHRVADAQPVNFDYVHQFRDIGPRSLSIANDGYLYGSSSGYGDARVFKIDGEGAVTVIHASFGVGAVPGHGLSTLTEGSDGNFYGVAGYGGAFGYGTVFKMTPTGAVTVLHAFLGGTDGGHPTLGGLLQGTDGNFYGTTSGIFQRSPGTIFRITPNGSLTTLYRFGGGLDGSSPAGPLIQASDGNFYGTTMNGGPGGACKDGLVFKMTPSGTVMIVHAFTGADGGLPQGLIQAKNGNLYGTTLRGGSYDSGTAFTIAVDGTFTLLASFSFGMASGLTEADGNFYGTTTSYKGWGEWMDRVRPNPYPWNTVFKMTPGGTLSILHEFYSDPTYLNPLGGDRPDGLVRAGDYFYGATSKGGAYDRGTVFRVRDLGAAFSESVHAPQPMARVAGLSVSSEMTAGGTYSVSLTMKNTGLSLWSTLTGHALGHDSVRVGVPAVIEPGELATFSFAVTAPTTPGSYYFGGDWQMVQDAVGWFGETSRPVLVNVTPPPPPVLCFDPVRRKLVPCEAW